MKMQLCVRCKKRPAMVFITRLENEKSVNEGLCLVCAKEIGVKPINDMLKSMGISDEELSGMSDGLASMIESAGENLPDEMPDQDLTDGHLPTMNLGEILGIPSRKKGEEQQRGKGGQRESSRKNLNLYCTNLNKKAMDGKIDRLIGRDRELDRIIQILCRRQKNNPCLIGEPGVGKTAIAEELAVRIVEGRVPEALAGFEVWMLDLTSLVAGTQFRGQFESRILALLKEIKQAGNIILMIDEVHNIAGAGETSDGSMSAANLLKPALSRGEIRVIGATTLKEYRKHIEKDSALERRFQPVKIEEPSVGETVDIIKGIKKYYEDFHGVTVSDDVARLAGVLSERYITDRFLPDKAIDLIDEACSKVSLSSAALNEKRRIDKKHAEVSIAMKELEATLESAEGQNNENYEKIADLRVELLRLEARQKELLPELELVRLTSNDIYKVIEIWTGIPVSELSVGEIEELRGLEDRIKEKIIGQDEAVSAVVRAVRRKRTGVSYRKTPVSMIFAGPTGVGKTELVKVLSNELFKQPESLIRLDMSEFMEKHSVSRIIGAPPGYVGYDEAGQLTEKIRRRPYSVILFDEIEKAHPDVLNILLQVLDDGIITDAQGRQINFENTVIVMTTNAGSEAASSISGFSEAREMRDKDKVNKALSSFLRPEFINRINEIVVFRSLDETDFVSIAAIMMKKLKDHMYEKGIALKYGDALLSHIAKGSYSYKYGARNMNRFIEKNIEDLMANELVAHDLTGISEMHLSVCNDDVKIDII